MIGKASSIMYVNVFFLSPHWVQVHRRCARHTWPRKYQSMLGTPLALIAGAPDCEVLRAAGFPKTRSLLYFTDLSSTVSSLTLEFGRNTVHHLKFVIALHSRVIMNYLCVERGKGEVARESERGSVGDKDGETYIEKETERSESWRQKNSQR